MKATKPYWLVKQLFVAVLAYVAVLWGSRLVWGRVGGGVG